jgi:ABC-type branched-subunit amino acid transport system ATPase component
VDSSVERARRAPRSKPAPAMERLIIQRRAGLGAVAPIAGSPERFPPMHTSNDCTQKRSDSIIVHNCLRLARAIVIDPKVLILDDAQAVDTCTEEEILARLKSVMRQRTSISVSHRISTVRNADHIFVLNQGRHRRRVHA